MLARLGTDAVKWANEFVTTFLGHTIGPRSKVDEGLMIAWFANAIGAGMTAGRDIGLEEWKQHAANLERALGELRADFICINNIAGQHPAYEGNKETP